MLRQARPERAGTVVSSNFFAPSRLRVNPIQPLSAPNHPMIASHEATKITKGAPLLRPFPAGVDYVQDAHHVFGGFVDQAVIGMDGQFAGVGECAGAAHVGEIEKLFGAFFKKRFHIEGGGGVISGDMFENGQAIRLGLGRPDQLHAAFSRSCSASQFARCAAMRSFISSCV